MQKGSLIRSSRRQGPDVWEYRWRESCSGEKRKHRRIVIGSLDTLRDESAALKAISALRRDININDRRMKTNPRTTPQSPTSFKSLATPEHRPPHALSPEQRRSPCLSLR
jgi:hypothetical protein